MSTITFSDAVDTVNIIGDVANLDTPANGNIILLEGGYEPQIATRNVRRRANEPAYQPVSERMRVYIRSTVLANTYSLLTRLIEIMDRAQQWRDEADIALGPVTYTFTATGGTALTSLLLGGPGRRSFLDMSARFNDDLAQFEIGPLNIDYERRGGRLEPVDLEQTTLSINNNAAIMTVTWPDNAQHYSPVDLVFNAEGGTAGLTSHDGLIFITDDPDKILQVSAHLATVNSTPASSSATTPSVPGESNNPVGAGEILRLEQGGAGSFNFDIDVSALTDDTKRIGIYAAVRNLNFDPWEINASPRPAGVSIGLGEPMRTLFYQGLSHEVIRLGVLSVPGPINDIRFTMEDTTQGGATNALLIDYFVFIALDDEATRVISVKDIGETVGETTRIDTGEQDKVRPELYSNGSGATLPRQYFGDTYIATKGTELSCLLALAGSTGWVLADELGTFTSVRMQANRRLLHLGPV